jgi:hypothetical protein
MDRDEALKLLKGGEEGIAEWNKRRENLEQILDLSDADLNGARLDGANLSKAYLDGANLIGANLSNAHLSGAILIRADLVAANLSNAHLSGANAHEADLDTANLNYADLSAANLSGANLSEAKLSGANLSGANLSGANLSGAKLSGANLSGAKLSQANISAADLSEATLTAAYCSQTTFANVDLSEVNGLDSVKHEGPSTVGIDTLFRARGNIPEAFLRGCGVPHELIAYLPTIISSMGPIQFYSCFISYSSKNHAFAERLHADLQANGVRCWIDDKDLKIGDKIRDRITEAIRIHDKLMLVLSEQSIDSDWVEGEVEAALEKERREKKTVLFPIRLDEAIMESRKGWASHIRQTRHIGNFRGWENHDAYQTAFARLLDDLKTETPPNPAR